MQAVTSRQNKISHTSGEGFYWEWDYEVTNADRGGGSGGSWAEADFDSSEYAEAWSNGGSSASAIPDNPQPQVWGESYYADVYPYVTDGVDVAWSLSASGTLTVWGMVGDDYLGSSDSVHASSGASGSCGGFAYGYGGVGGSVDEFSTGNAWTSVDGEAEETYADTDVYAGHFYATLSFSIYASDTKYGVEADPPGQAGSNWYTGTAGLSSGADAYASVSASAGYSGDAYASAGLDFGGSATVSVTLP